MNQIIGRTEEIHRLKEYYASAKPVFLAIYGRRRVGKTFLVDQCFDYKYDFYMSGVIEGSYDDQIYAFNSALKEYGYEGAVAKNWREVFANLRALLEKHIDKKRVLVFIDELPCLDTPRSGFIKAFDSFWNSWASKHSNIMLIVCGSATSWMIDNIIDSHGGLHNRITHEMHIKSFCLRETREYLDKAGVCWDMLTIAQCYMCMGGIPYYLSLIDPALSLAQNLDALYFSADGALKREYNRLFNALFRKPDKYIKVIECLANSRSGLTRKQLIEASKIESGDEISRILRNLEYCDFIRSFSTTARPSAVNGRAYQLLDFFVLFYLKFCKKQSTDPQFWSHTLGQSIQNDWFGLMFELLCVLHISEIKRALGIDGIHTEYAGWRSKTDIKAQIDLLIDRADGIVNVCEIKYSKGEYQLDKDEAEKISCRVQAFEDSVSLHKGIQIVLITPYGLRPSKYSSLISRIVTLSQLF